MKNLLPWLISALLLSFTVAALFELQAYLSLDSVRKNSPLAAATENQAIILGMSLTPEERQDELEKAKLASQRLFADDKAASVYGRVARRLAFSELNQDKRLSLFCQALDGFATAIKRNPHDALNLTNWANLKQILGSATCPGQIDLLSLNHALEQAAKIDPQNPSLLYALGQVYLWISNKQQALALFQRALLLGSNITEGQGRLIFSTVSEPKDLERLLPARFPQVVHWGTLFKSWNRQAYDRSAEVLSQIQIRAIRGSIDEYRQKLIPADLLEKRLFSLLGNTANDLARKVLDQELGNFLAYNGRANLSKYLLERSQSNKISFVPALQVSDTRPLRSTMLHWNEQGVVKLDTFFNSVGFYTPRAQTIQMIELNAQDFATSIDSLNLPSFNLLVSEDNQNWAEQPLIKDPEIFALPDAKALIVFEPVKSPYAYWKIHFSSGLRQGSFKNELSQIISVYGK